MDYNSIWNDTLIDFRLEMLYCLDEPFIAFLMSCKIIAYNFYEINNRKREELFLGDVKEEFKITRILTPTTNNHIHISLNKISGRWDFSSMSYPLNKAQVDYLNLIFNNYITKLNQTITTH